MASADNSVLLGPTLPGAAKERSDRTESGGSRYQIGHSLNSRRFLARGGSLRRGLQTITRKRKEENANSQTDAYHCVVSRLGSYHGDSGPVPFSRSATRPCGPGADHH